MPARRPTLADIAAEAGVAVSTVSKVLNGHSDISAATRTRVEQLLAERGYRRPPGLRRHGRDTRLVDLVINEMDSPWGLSLLTGVEEVTERAGLSLVVSAVHHRSSATWQWLELLAGRGSQGALLVHSRLSGDQQAELDRRGLPYVVVDGVDGPPPPEKPSVGVDNLAGGRAATEHLVALGHRRIGVIGGPQALLCTRARIAGHREVCRAAGIPADRRLVRYAEFRYDGGLRAARALLALDDPPTAVFAGSDQQAGGVYDAVREAGLTVPGDVSVVGFDDVPFARWMAPPLTTVRQPLHEMGALAATMLLRLVRGERLEQPRVELPTRLTVRDSTAPLSGFESR